MVSKPDRILLRTVSAASDVVGTAEYVPPASQHRVVLRLTGEQ